MLKLGFNNKKRKMKNKEKTAVISCGFDEIDKHLVTNLYHFNNQEVYKLFGAHLPKNKQK